ncbi:MAG TPA: NAD(P)/FAD-dependent oxidoreductase [Vicinamibacteria bacterium]|nr:NAD(P)/FAD-dependent oxidoreductase [Vicinamibacteria bacterium]
MSALDRMDSRYDVLVVGARAAGAATAMLLARAGLRVLAVDRGAYGTDTLSTHALMRAGVLQLARWGVLDRIVAAGTPPVRRTVFHYEDGAIDVPIKPRDRVPALFAPRRTVLDRALVDAALEAGATVVHRIGVADLLRGRDGRVQGVILGEEGRMRAVGADLVIGADGLRSAVAALVGAPTTRRGAYASANIYGYWSGLKADGYHWHWAPGAAAGAIPTNGGEVLVFASVSSRRFMEEVRSDVPRGYRRVLEEAAPELAAALPRASLAGPLHGFPGQVGYLRRPFGPGWALVGDAAYFKDPITAHGLSDALRDAELLARAVVHGGDEALAGYEAARDALSERLFDVTDRVASFDWDTAALKALHLAFSDEMKREVAEMLRFPAALAPSDRLTA